MTGPTPLSEPMLAELMRLHGASDPATQAAILTALQDSRAARTQRFILDLVGVAAGLAVVITFLLVSADLIRDGHGWEGTVLGGVDIVALAAIFVLRQYYAPSKRPEVAAADRETDQGG